MFSQFKHGRAVCPIDDRQATPGVRRMIARVTFCSRSWWRVGRVRRMSTNFGRSGDSVCFRSGDQVIEGAVGWAPSTPHAARISQLRIPSRTPSQFFYPLRTSCGSGISRRFELAALCPLLTHAETNVPQLACRHTFAKSGPVRIPDRSRALRRIESCLVFRPDYIVLILVGRECSPSLFGIAVMLTVAGK
jgi:hypothetical protein